MRFQGKLLGSTIALAMLLMVAACGPMMGKGCKKGKPCGNSCIARDRECHQG